MVINISHSPAETAALGELWGSSAELGLVIGLCGDLGAGKTQLVKGLARGLGIKMSVHSPTFALVNVYNGGRLTLFHLDLYRLDTIEQIIAAGLEEYLHPKGVTVIEWADRWFGPDPTNIAWLKPVTPHSLKTAAQTFRWVQLEILDPSERRISYEDSGS